MLEAPQRGLDEDPEEVLLSATGLSEREPSHLLRTIRSQLAADTAVILVLDPTRTVLEPFAMSGVGRSRRVWARIPVGKGFAGRVAVSRAPVVLDQVSDTNVFNPVLRQNGVRSLAGVPLLDEDKLIGVLHVGSRTPRHFGDVELEQLHRFAGEVVTVIRDTTAGAEHTAALVLQHSLLPSVPPTVPGLDVAGRYVPAEGDLGGDWYDVFELPNGHIGFVMGDVAGHGLRAAVVMGRLKAALRAYALTSDDPAEVLALLDRKMSYFEPTAMATVVYGVTQEPYETVRFSSAGHWPPVIGRPDGTSEIVESPRNLALGVDLEVPRSVFEVHLDPGAVLCLFTDGLVEISHEADPQQLLESLADRIACLDASESADLSCSRLLADTIGSTANFDDIAVMLIRRSAEAR
jgi:putative methionine-R-sulfoxide reductase with GAF domain